MAKAVLINPNNEAIDTRYDPNDIDDPFSYRARDGFIGIGPLWANNDDGTVYIQGHVVIPNPWGNVSTNGTTTTTTDDTTDKDGGDDAEPCGRFDAGCFNGHCFSDCWKRETGRSWSNDRKTISEIALIESRLARNEDAEANIKLLYAIAGVVGIIGVFAGGVGIIIAGIFAGEIPIAEYINSLDTKKLKAKRDKIYKDNPWLKDTDEIEKDLKTCEGECCGGGTNRWTGSQPLSEPGNFIVAINC